MRAHLTLLSCVAFLGWGCHDAHPRREAAVPASLPASSKRAVVVDEASPARAEPASAPAPAPVASAAPEPARVERVEVPNDQPASFVRGTPGSTFHVVFMPGKCSNAYAYLLTFPEAARAHGGIVAIEGDEPCGPPGSGFHSFSWKPELQRARVAAALAAVGMEAPATGLTLIGYSSGASIAERMHAEDERLYPRLVLIAPPVDPDMGRLRGSDAVVTMACSLDVTSRMKMATKSLERAGIPSVYFEMPGCTHGNIAEGERIFGEAFDWLDQRAVPRD